MSFVGLASQPVTIRRAARSTDRYGNDIADWTDVTDTAATAWIAQRGGSERLDHRDGEASTWIALFDPCVDITAADRGLRGALVFEVAGPINPAYRQGELHHIEVPLEVFEG